MPPPPITSLRLNHRDVTPLSMPSMLLDAIPSQPSESSVDLAGVLAAGCELANTRASKVLAVRSEQNAELSLEQFVELFKENWDFVVATEGMAKRMIVSLRGTTASQVGLLPLLSLREWRLTPGPRLPGQVPFHPPHQVRESRSRRAMDPDRRGPRSTTCRRPPNRSSYGGST